MLSLPSLFELPSFSPIIAVGNLPQNVLPCRNSRIQSDSRVARQASETWDPQCRLLVPCHFDPLLQDCNPLEHPLAGTSSPPAIWLGEGGLFRSRYPHSGDGEPPWVWISLDLCSVTD